MIVFTVDKLDPISIPGIRFILLCRMWYVINLVVVDITVFLTPWFPQLEILCPIEQ